MQINKHQRIRQTSVILWSLVLSGSYFFLLKLQILPIELSWEIQIRIRKKWSQKVLCGLSGLCMHIEHGLARRKCSRSVCKRYYHSSRNELNRKASAVFPVHCWLVGVTSPEDDSLFTDKGWAANSHTASQAPRGERTLIIGVNDLPRWFQKCARLTGRLWIKRTPCTNEPDMKEHCRWFDGSGMWEQEGDQGLVWRGVSRRAWQSHGLGFHVQLCDC